MTGGGGRDAEEDARGARALEAWETKTALERALRHPQNDLEVDGACGMVLKKQCSHVRQARDLAAEAWRRGAVRGGVGGEGGAAKGEETNDDGRGGEGSER